MNPFAAHATGGRALRVALISEHASPLADLGGVDAGGQNVYVDKVARGLAARGHRVDVYTRRDAADLPASVEPVRGMRVVHVDAGPAVHVPKEAMLDLMPCFTSAVQRCMRHQAPCDVVHANFFMSGLVGLWLRERLGLPLVTTFHALGLVRREHQGSADTFPGERMAIEQRIVRQADRIVAECPQDRADLLRLYGAAPERIDTVPCGVDPTEFDGCDRQAARRAFGIAPDEFVLLQLGRMVPRKGVDNVIRALALLQQAGGAPQRAWRLLVVGGDGAGAAPDRTVATGGCATELARLRALAIELGVQARVIFAGHRQRQQVADCYAACDAFVTTPWYEPFGITPLEAMAASRPVIGSAVGGIQHTVVDGSTGFLVPPHDPAALAERIGRLQQDPALAQAMGRAGRSRVLASFTWDRVVDALVDVYRAVAAPATALESPLRRAAMQPSARAAA